MNRQLLNLVGAANEITAVAEELQARGVADDLVKRLIGPIRTIAEVTLKLTEDETRLREMLTQ